MLQFKFVISNLHVRTFQPFLNSNSSRVFCQTQGAIFMIWTKDKARNFLLNIADSLPPDVKSATEFILNELDKVEKNSTKDEFNPRVEIIDENHQRFNGEIYTKRKKNGYYYCTKILHTEVYKFYSGLNEIPKNFLIHHASNNERGAYDKDKNNIEDLRLMTRKAHTALHNPELGRVAIFICKNCGKEYESRSMGANCYCSKKCKNEWQNKEKHKVENRVIKNCEWCGKEFSDWKYGHKKFCSSSCAKYSQWKKMISRGKYSTGKDRILTNEQVKYIRKVYKPRDKAFGQAALAKYFGVRASVIGRIVRRESYTDVE